MKLSPEQVEKRGQILQEMADIYHRQHSWMTRDDALYAFCEWIEEDPLKLRFINGLAASKLA